MKNNYSKKQDVVMVVLRFVLRISCLFAGFCGYMYSIAVNHGDTIFDSQIRAFGFIVIGIMLFFLIPWHTLTSNNKYAWDRYDQLIDIYNSTEDINLRSWTNRLLNYLKACGDKNNNVKIDTMEDYIKKSIEYGCDNNFGCFEDELDEDEKFVFIDKLTTFINMAA